MDIRCKGFVVVIVAGAAVGTLVACGQKKETKVAVADGGPAPIVSEGPPKPPPLTPQRLAPTLHEIGVEGAVPRGIVVELATPVIDRSRVGEASAKTQLAVTPETDGEISWTGVSTLTFVPSKPLAFGTRYKVDLTAVETRDGVVAPAEGERWTREFTTPAFAFKRWSPVENDVAKHRLVMDLVFTGAVLPNRAKPYLVFSIDGKPTANVAFQPAGSPNISRAVITDPRIVLGTNVKSATPGRSAPTPSTPWSSGSATWTTSPRRSSSAPRPPGRSSSTCWRRSPTGRALLCRKRRPPTSAGSRSARTRGTSPARRVLGARACSRQSTRSRPRRVRTTSPTTSTSRPARR